MAAVSDARNAWVERVLGVRVSSAAGQPAESAARAAEAASVSRGAVRFGALQLQWREAQGRVQANLRQLADAVLGFPGIQGDPRFGQVKAVAGRLTGLVPAFGGRLEDVLDAAANAGRLTSLLADDSAAAIADYRAMLAKAPELLKLQAFAGKHLKLDIRIYSDLDDTLASLSVELKRAGGGAAPGV